jgi:3-hydroxyacyl-[acyl-carrier-protein] dehydratase
MLQNDFFTINAVNGEGYSFTVILELNATHRIFDGHFPGRPVVPGACMMQMVQEVTENVLSRKLKLMKADKIKFIKPIDPNSNRILEMQLSFSRREDESLNVSASLSDKERICFKFTGLFLPE